MATAAAAMVARARRQIQHHFFAADAVRPDRAIDFEPANRFERRQFQRYCDTGIVQSVGAGRYWMDVVAYDIALRRRHAFIRTAMLIVICVLLIVAAVATVTASQEGAATSPAAVH